MNGNKHFQNRVGNRWTILVCIVVFALLLGGCAAKEPKVYRVGIIKGGSFAVIADGFTAGMAELGYVEGENIVYDAPDAGDDMSRAPGIAEQFVADQVDLIFTAGSTPGALAAQAATEGTDIPVVFAYATTEETNLIASVREPGGNLTGVRYPGHEMMVKRLELLLEIAPEVERVWIGYDVNSPNTDAALETLHAAAPSLGLTLVEAPATTFEEIEADLAARAAADDIGLDAIILMPDAFSHVPDYLGVLSQFAAEHGVPLGGSMLYTVQMGAVFGNANDLVKVGELAAPIADKVLKGTPAGTIPVVTPEQDLYINYIVAQELGLTVPEGLLSQAAEIIR
jgi:putative ABC transport system substrate-binding protein